MINRETIKYSLRNLEKRKGRSFLTVISIFAGITAIFLFVSFGLGLRAYVEEFTKDTSVDKVAIMPRGVGAPGLDDTFALSEEDLEAVEKSGGVYEASGVYVKPAEVKEGEKIKFVFLNAYNPEKPLILEFFGDIGIYKGRLLRDNEDDKVVLGFNYLIENKIFSRAFDLNDKITIQGKDFRVVGFFEPIGNPQDDSNVYVTEEAIDNIYNGTNNYNMIIARVDIENINNAIDNIEKNLRKERGLEEGKEDFFVQSFQELLESYSSVLNIIIGFIILIALVSVLVSAINTANTMITSVLERYKEIGIMKAIGAKNSEIFGIFLFESAFLGFVAGAFGTGVGWILAYGAGKILTNFGWGFLSPIFPSYLFIGCILFATITGAISGVVPAIRASKIKPVRALRYE